ncbi:hypothetical protein AB4586_18050 [Vibrio sp. 10N.222.49.E4]
MKTLLFKTGPMINQKTKMGLYFLLGWGIGLLTGVSVGINQKLFINLITEQPPVVMSPSYIDAVLVVPAITTENFADE